jgi:hypothetical protein
MSNLPSATRAIWPACQIDPGEDQAFGSSFAITESAELPPIRAHD